MSTVSREALIKRLNRKLQADDEAVRSSRSEWDRQNLGDFYIWSPQHNWIVSTHIDLVAYGRERGVLADYEHIVDA